MNSDGILVLSAGSLTSFSVEIIKWIIRKWVVKNPEFDFPPIFYELSLPLVTALWGVLLYYVGIGEGQLMEWKTLLEWFISVVLSLATYVLVNKPFKDFVKTYNITKG